METAGMIVLVVRLDRKLHSYEAIGPSLSHGCVSLMALEPLCSDLV